MALKYDLGIAFENRNNGAGKYSGRESQLEQELPEKMVWDINKNQRLKYTTDPQNPDGSLCDASKVKLFFSSMSKNKDTAIPEYTYSGEEFPTLRPEL